MDISSIIGLHSNTTDLLHYFPGVESNEAAPYRGSDRGGQEPEGVAEKSEEDQGHLPHPQHVQHRREPELSHSRVLVPHEGC